MFGGFTMFFFGSGFVLPVVTHFGRIMGPKIGACFVSKTT